MASEQPMTSASASTRRCGLGVAGLGLDPGERVEGRHQRQVELVLEAVAGHARQPVVGVEGVDVAAAREVVAARRRRTSSTTSGSCSLAQVGGPGVDVDDPEARARPRRSSGQVVVASGG